MFRMYLFRLIEKFYTTIKYFKIKTIQFNALVSRILLAIFTDRSYKNKNIFCFLSQSTGEKSIKLPKHWVIVY